MKYQDRTKGRLMSELAAMQRRVAELEALASHRKHAQTAAEAMIDTVREPLLLLDEHLKVLSASRRATPPLTSRDSSTSW
jgi:hypothetical protein